MPSITKGLCTAPGCFAIADGTGRCEKHEREPARDLGHLLLPVPPKPSCTVILVAGAPASGKSTYVLDNASPGDSVIDLDHIKARLTGASLYQAPDDVDTLERALIQRNADLAALATKPKRHRAWFVTGAPEVGQRRHWRRVLGAEVIVMETPIEEIRRRIRSDARRKGKRPEMIRWANLWWARYRRDSEDKVVRFEK